jgi:hypothetical protein
VRRRARAVLGPAVVALGPTLIRASLVRTAFVVAALIAAAVERAARGMRRRRRV